MSAAHGRHDRQADVSAAHLDQGAIRRTRLSSEGPRGSSRQHGTETEDSPPRQGRPAVRRPIRSVPRRPRAAHVAPQCDPHPCGRASARPPPPVGPATSPPPSRSPRGVLAEGSTVPQFPRLRALVAATLAALVIVTIQPPAPGAAETPTPIAPPATVAPTPIPSPLPTPVVSPVAGASPAAAPATAEAPAPAPTTNLSRKRAETAPRADRVIAVALAKRGRPWAYGATGPRAFDCSGLVTYAFRRAGVLAQIGSGRNRGGSSMLRWARARHLTRSVGHRGDVVVWGNGAHVGIYLGKGRAISTLTSGVRVHGLRVLNTRFTTFISTGLSGPGRAVDDAAAKGDHRRRRGGPRCGPGNGGRPANRDRYPAQPPRRTAPDSLRLAHPRARDAPWRAPLDTRRRGPNVVPGHRRDTDRLGRRLADAPCDLTGAQVALCRPTLRFAAGRRWPGW